MKEYHIRYKENLENLMTAKQKAEELIKKREEITQNKWKAIECSIMDMDDIIKIFEDQMPPLTTLYYKDVKVELVNMMKKIINE